MCPEVSRMGLNLPGSQVYLAQVPDSIKKLSPDLHSYLERLQRALDESNRAHFSNSFLIATTINSGTAGTFVIGTSTLSVINGIVTKVA